MSWLQLQGDKQHTTQIKDANYANICWYLHYHVMCYICLVVTFGFPNYHIVLLWCHTAYRMIYCVFQQKSTDDLTSQQTQI